MNRKENEDRKEVALSTFDYIKLGVWDVPSSILDTYMGFSIGLNLLNGRFTKNYGIVSLIINWVPGLVTFFHVASSFREKYSIVVTVLASIFALISYPLLLALTSIYTLLRRPKDNEMSEEFRKTLKYLTIIQTISGCFEAPMKMIYNLWLVLNGHQDAEFGVKCNYYQDLNGNSICVPVSVSVSIIFSIIMTIVSVFTINSSQSKKINSSKWSSFEHFPFLVAGILFKIASVVLITTYITYWAIFPIVILFISCLTLNEIMQPKVDYKASKWLVLFLTILVPYLSVSSNIKNRRYFAYQMLLTVLIYSLTLIAIYITVETGSLKLNKFLILNNFAFNVVFWSTMAMGMMSVILAIPKIINFSSGHKALNSNSQKRFCTLDFACWAVGIYQF